MIASALDRLHADVLEEAELRRCTPLATYRLQMHRDFTIADARRISPYLHSLGISHVYTSSLLAAKPGSLHGYDVCNHRILNPELGTETEFLEWSKELTALGMGLILDTVPNHMCVGGCTNEWWRDVLENGLSSPFASSFDIAWNDHPRLQLQNKVLLPILGKSYGETLEAGELKLHFQAGGFHLQFGDTQLPIDPRTYGEFLAHTLDSLKEKLGTDADEVVELSSILNSIHHLPSRVETDSNRKVAGRTEASVIRRRLNELFDKDTIANEHLYRILDQWNGIVGNSDSFTRLDQLLEIQAYRLCFWRVASDEINYRRFFDVTDLAAISVEREEVFYATHEKIFEWLALGVAQGLRIDHPDGLFDPKQYLDRLQLNYLLSLAKRKISLESDRYLGLAWETAESQLRERFSTHKSDFLYVVVEKILTGPESLPSDWITAGTTGYEYLNIVNGLLVDPSHETAFTQGYQNFIGSTDRYEEIVYRNKLLILQSSLASELQMLANQLDRLAQSGRWSRDFTLNGIRHALREVIACFPVYRSYIREEVSDADRMLVNRAVQRARRRNPLLGDPLFFFIRDTLLLKDPPSGSPSREYRTAQIHFAGKFQQVTSPIMAKGLEDTTFYVYNRLVSLNEVGGDPNRFGRRTAEVHRYFLDRANRFPLALSPLSTHDTKRAEDVRARINVLSEIPDIWMEKVRQWSDFNRPHRIELDDGLSAPDANEEYLIYQTLIGAWPMEEDVDGNHQAFEERFLAYLNKAVHEAKVHTSWLNPNTEYDLAVKEFTCRILNPQISSEFLAI